MHPAAGKGGAGEAVEVGQQPGIDAGPVSGRLVPAALEALAVLPDRFDLAGRAHVGCRVAPDEDQVGLESGRDPAPVVQPEGVRGAAAVAARRASRGVSPARTRSSSSRWTLAP